MRLVEEGEQPAVSKGALRGLMYLRKQVRDKKPVRSTRDVKKALEWIDALVDGEFAEVEETTEFT